ncbi:hypothetical protein M758_8G183400 [Ceratodon purpureus]|nr:hypothetical protein M758_8G183400 [Ceratodon purpureus]
MGAAISYCSPQEVLNTAICGDDGNGPDYMHLPCPAKYNEITREAYMSLKPELFEGLRFDITRPLNNKFALSNSLFMGSVGLPGNRQSKAHFELGADLVDQKGKMDIVLVMGRVLSDARMSARVKYDVNERFSIKADAQLTNDPHFTVGMFNFDYKGNDYQAQLTMGNNAYYGVNYMQWWSRV